jgi:hypothetical protein
MANENDILRRVRALLAKAESTTEEEASALVAKAQELIVRYAIDEAQLAKDPRVERKRPVAKRFAYSETRGYKEAKIQLLGGLERALGLKVALHGYSRSGHEECTVVGFEEDVQFFELLYTSLLVQGFRAAAEAHEAAPREWAWNERTWQDEYRKPNRRRFTNSFLRGFVYRVTERLKETRQEVVKSTGSELVLVDRSEEVAEAFGELFPNLGTHRSSYSADGKAWGAGSRAANRADLSGGAGHLGSQRALGGR